MSGQALAEVMKQLAGQAEDAGRPSDYILGTVESSDTLAIRVSRIFDYHRRGARL